jgi:hypothetical protein
VRRTQRNAGGNEAFASSQQNAAIRRDDMLVKSGLLLCGRLRQKRSNEEKAISCSRNCAPVADVPSANLYKRMTYRLQALSRI